MSKKTAARIAWSLASVAIAFGLGGVVFRIVNWSTPVPGALDPAFEVVLGLAFLAFPIVGALIASRRPRNVIGWLLCSLGVPFALSGLALEYGIYGLFTEPGSLPGAEIAAWLASWLFLPPLFSLVPLLFLLFPDGRLLSRRWRPVVWLTLAAMVANAARAALAPGYLQEVPFHRVVNPLGVEALESALAALQYFGWTAVALTIVASAVSMLLRLRRARGVERQQIKWIAAAASAFALSWFVAMVTFSLGGEQVGQLLVLLAFVSIPVAAGIAILRYRLYDIDVVINRTLVYGALTAVLAGTYVGLVLLFQLLLDPLTQGSELAVAVSTLAVAALFRPGRRRIQGLVDRRFYRRKYDAERTLAAFSARLREQVELETLAADLAAVVRETVEPTHVSLWLREAGR